MNKIDYNKKMLGKTALVRGELGKEREVKILGVVDEENFEVIEEEGGVKYIVSMYDIRSLKNEKTTK
ncbi:MAG: hypothetical protein H8E05_01305 [Bacteroidetes bacterium]|nr:hypothetical protein [Bacteroidota bacterium]